MAAASSEILMGEWETREREMWSHEGHKRFKQRTFPTLNTPKSGKCQFGLLPGSSDVGSAVDFCVQLVQEEPEELLRILLTGLNTETKTPYVTGSYFYSSLKCKGNLYSR